MSQFDFEQFSESGDTFRRSAKFRCVAEELRPLLLRTLRREQPICLRTCGIDLREELAGLGRGE